MDIKYVFRFKNIIWKLKYSNIISKQRFDIFNRVKKLKKLNSLVNAIYY